MFQPEDQNHILELKKAYRKNMLTQLASISNLDYENKSQLVQQNLVAFFADKKGAWGCFSNLKTEPKINWELLNPLIDWFQVFVENNKLVFKNNIGQVKSVDSLDGVCVPAVAFNTNGARLGRGHGYYDKTLQTFKNNKIGICFQQSLNQDVPYEAHDVKMDIVITEFGFEKTLFEIKENSWN